MELYFGSHKPGGGDGKSNQRLVCFSIPRAGISFKAPFSGDKLHTQYASLLTLLEFVELNQKIFSGKSLKIYGDDLDLINQINELKKPEYEFTELLKKALDYKKKYNYQIGWVPKESNPSTGSLFD
jgi:hypothetical protein